MTDKIQLLVIQGTSHDIHFIDTALAARKWTEHFQVVCSTTLEDAFAQLAVKKFGIIFLSSALLNTVETKFAARMLEGATDIPVLSLRSLLDNCHEPSAGFDEIAQNILMRSLENCWSEWAGSSRTGTAISSYKALERALSKEKEQIEGILKSMGDAVITTDANSRIRDFNPEAEKLTGWSVDMARHRSVSEVCKLIDGQTRQPLEDLSVLALREGKAVSLSNHPTLISKEGKEIAVDDSAAPIRDRQGQAIGTVLVFRDVSVERDRAQQLTWQATHDPLTNLANRQHFVDQLAQASYQPQQSNVVCYIDLDHFKVVNDTCGHAAGDELLRQVSRLLSANIRQTDLLARLGGDEFGLIIYDCPIEQSHAIACKLCSVIQKFRFLWQDKVFSIGASIGLVPIPPEGAPAAQLMSLADAACYAAKNKGRNQVQLYSEDNLDVMQMSADFEWFSRITQAIEEDGFCIYSQEVKPTDPSKDVIVELLLRLSDAKTGKLMPPMAFIPPAERYDLMPKLDQWMIRHCFERLEGTHTPGVLYSINLSGDTLNNDQLDSFLAQMLSEFHIDPRRICFEITETSAIANLNQVSTTILNLKKLGFRFALDDFGSGMSSFVYLKQLPIDYLKIDGGLVSEINQDEVALATLKSINDIGHIMGLQTVAEYVSTPEIHQAVRALNVDYMQGFEIARPRPFTPENRQLSDDTNKATLVKDSHNIMISSRH